MKKKFISIITAAAFFIVAGTNTHAEQIIIQKGDTLWDLSNQYKTSVQAIKNLNNLSDDLIFPNDVLKVSPSNTFSVRKGDTLWDIGQVYDVPVEDLMKWNQLSSDLIHPSLELVIHTSLQNEANEKEAKQNLVPSINLEQDEATPEEAVTSEEKQDETAPVETTTSEEPVESTPADTPANTPASEEQVEQSPVETVTPEETAATAPVETASPEEPAGKEITVEATAYTAECEGCSGITKTGVDLKANPDEKVIAVDPSVIPLGSKVYVEGYGYATAEDIGGGINGHEIDVFVPEHDDAVDWGRKEVKVTIID